MDIEYLEDKSKRVWKSGTFIYPIPAALVSSGNMKKSNILTVAWTGILNTNPAIVYVSIRPERYSYNLIKENKEFCINLTNENLVFETDWCGVKSGAEFDKFKELNLTKQKGKFVKCPLIKEAPVSIECKVIEEKKYGSHVCFIAEVLSIDADDKYFDENGAFDISKCDLIAYANGGYYTLGKKIGTFGYSVSKKNKTEIKNVRKKNLNKEKNVKQNSKKTIKEDGKKISKNNNKKGKNNNRKKLKK